MSFVSGSYDVESTSLPGSVGGMAQSGSTDSSGYPGAQNVADQSSGPDGGSGEGISSQNSETVEVTDEFGNTSLVVKPIGGSSSFWSSVKDAAKWADDKLTGAGGGRPALITGFLPAAAAPLAIPAIFTKGMTALGFEPSPDHDGMAISINDAASVTFDGYGTPRDPITVYGLENFPTLTSGAGMARPPNDPTKGIGNVGGNSGSVGTSGVNSVLGGGGGSGNSPGPVIVETDNSQLTALIAAIATFAFSVFVL